MNTGPIRMFQVDAMNTSFTIRVPENQSAALESNFRQFSELLEELESSLSRYRHDSDISRVNTMQSGDTLFISPHAHACLKQAMQAYQATQGLFDVTLGRQIRNLKEQQGSTVSDHSGQLKIAEDQPLVECITPGREIDLGGIGKGYALDQWGKLIKSLPIDSALLSAGTSTHLAVGANPWPIEMLYEHGQKSYPLKRGAFSVSGVQVQGNHLVHPDSIDEETPLSLKQVWVAHAEATFADAYSTACLLMHPEEIQDFFKAPTGITFLQTETNGTSELVTLGEVTG